MSDGANGLPSDGLSWPELNDTLTKFVTRIGKGLEDVCSYGLIVAESYVPFDPDDGDCGDDDDFIYDENGDSLGPCSQAWVRLVSMSTNVANTDFSGDALDIEPILNLEIGVLRCFPIREDGEAPLASEMVAAAASSMDDMNAILCLMSDAEAEKMWQWTRPGQWQPLGPQGGQVGGVWTYTAQPFMN